MNSKRHDWVATPGETKIAWIVATATAILVVGAFLWPQSESRKPEIEAVVKEQPEEESIEKIITKVQSAEKHQIKAAAEPTSRPMTTPEPAPATIKPVAKAESGTVTKKPAPVIAPKTVTKAPVAKQAKSSTSVLSSGYYVQTGAFSDRKHAEALMKRLSTSWKTEIKKKPNNLFAVWSGPYANPEEATAAKNSIAMRTKIKGFIVKN